MKLLVFGFRRNISERLALLIQAHKATIILSSNYASIMEFVENTDFGKYDYVLGLGMYSGRDRNSIRIETQCTSKFRNAGSREERISIPHFFKPADGMKLAEGIGNSWCNLVSFKILSKHPEARYSFLHVPKQYDINSAVLAINKQIAKLDDCIALMAKH